MMVDVQERLLPSISNHEAVLSNSVKLLRAAEVLSLPALYTEQYPKGIGKTVDELLNVLPQGTCRTEKTAFSCCDEPGFIEAFREFKRPTAVIFGIETHICILSTVIDLIHMGHNVVLAADACGSRNPDNHALALEAIRACGAAVLPTESVIYLMLGASGTSEFKALLPLFK